MFYKKKKEICVWGELNCDLSYSSGEVFTGWYLSVEKNETAAECVDE